MAEQYLIGLGKFTLRALDIIFMDAFGTWILHDVKHHMYLKWHLILHQRTWSLISWLSLVPFNGDGNFQEDMGIESSGKACI